MKVLLIEDDPASRELMRLRLQALDCRVIDADTAEAGLRLAAAVKPDLILLDMRLEHELAGPHVLRALRDHPATASVPVVIHSIYVNEAHDLPDGLPKADGLLPKPFKFQELRTLVERFRPAEDTPPAGLVLDAASRDKHRKGAWWPEAL
jgi:CheY-like chemotaxis protein